MSPTMGSAGDAASFSDRQFIAITSEKYAKVIALPSQNCVYRQQIAFESDYAVKAEIVSLKGKVDISIKMYTRNCSILLTKRMIPHWCL